MPETMTWITQLDNALSRAKQESKSVLLDFFNPG